MQIMGIQRSGVLVKLDPDDCYLLAEACHRAVAAADDDEPTVYLYNLVASLLEGYALVGAAPAYMLQQQATHFTPADVIATWKVAR